MSLVTAAERALGRRNLVLVGFMGTGKSTLGAGVASALRRRFVDTDALVAARAGCGIPEIFATLGEAGFRDLEAAAVAEAAAGARCVLATGGGVLGRPANLEALRAGGVLVALVAEPQVLLRRVGGAGGARRRPLLAGGGDPLARIEELQRARATLYAQADLTLDTTHLSRHAAVLALLRLCAAQAAAVRPVPAGPGGTQPPAPGARAQAARRRSRPAPGAGARGAQPDGGAPQPPGP